MAKVWVIKVGDRYLREEVLTSKDPHICIRLSYQKKVADATKWSSKPHAEGYMESANVFGKPEFLEVEA